MSVTRLIRRLLRQPEYVVVTLDDVLPMYGEGDTREEAIADLVGSLISLRAMLEEDPARLSPHLEGELDILRRLMVPLPPYTVNVSNEYTYTSNSGSSTTASR